MKRSCRGFTLIEMIVATMLLAIGVLGALQAFTMATRASTYGEQIQTATLLLQKQMGDAEVNASTLSGGDSEGDFEDPNAEYHWKQSVETTDYQDLFKVTVTVQWGDKSKPSERALTAFIRKDLNQPAQPNSSGSTSPAGGSGGG